MNKKEIVLYIFIFLLAVFVVGLYTDYDFDLFARLEVGEIFFKLHKVLLHDPFSYTPTHAWLDHEWASGVVFYAVLKLLGPAGIVLLSGLLFTLTAVPIIKYNKNIAYPLFIGAGFIYFLQYTAGNLVRCQSFTFVFISLTLFLLEKLRQDNTKWVWLLPILIAFWCNMHGGVASGLGIISVYCLIAIIKREKFAKTLFFVTLLSYLALFINPYGMHYPMYLYSAVTIPRKYIEDWQSAFHPRFFFIYYWIIILFITMIGIKIRRDFANKHFDIYHYILLFGTVFFGFAHVKGIEAAGIIVFMFCSTDVDYYLKNFSLSKNINKCLYAVIIALALTIPFTIFTPRVTFSRFPITEVEFLKINNIKGNLLVPFELGSYASYKLYPNNKIYIDGRYDGVYPMEVFDDATNFLAGKENWDNIVTKYPTDIIIYTIDFPSVIKLLMTGKWVNVYQGNKYCVIMKKSLLKKDLKTPSTNLEYYRKNIFKTDFINYLKEEKND